MLTNDEKRLRTPLKRVRGLGASKSGVGHWWRTRLTSLALIPLTLWFILAVTGWAGCASYQDTRIWMASPLNALLLILLTLIMFQHAASGIQAVLEDYVHKEGRKLVFIYGVKTICFVLAAACVLSILKIFLGR